MLRYKNLGTSIISVDLQNGYSVVSIASWNKEIRKYEVTLYLKDNSIRSLHLIDDAEKVEMESDRKSINTTMANYITDLLTDGFFKSCIDRYKYWEDCFNRGNELFEQERLDKTII